MGVRGGGGKEGFGEVERGRRREKLQWGLELGVSMGCEGVDFQGVKGGGGGGGKGVRQSGKYDKEAKKDGDWGDELEMESTEGGGGWERGGRATREGGGGKRGGRI